MPRSRAAENMPARHSFYSAIRQYFDSALIYFAATTLPVPSRLRRRTARAGAVTQDVAAHDMRWPCGRRRSAVGHFERARGVSPPPRRLCRGVRGYRDDYATGTMKALRCRQYRHRRHSARQLFAEPSPPWALFAGRSRHIHAITPFPQLPSLATTPLYILPRPRVMSNTTQRHYRPIAARRRQRAPLSLYAARCFAVYFTSGTR